MARASAAPPTCRLRRTGSAPGDFGYLYDGKFLNESLRLVQYVPSAAEPFQFVVRIGETRRKRTRLATEATLAMVPIQVVFIGTSVLLVWLGVGWGLRPLEALRTAIARRDHSDLEPLSLRGLPSELRSQAKAINELMARLRVVLDGGGVSSPMRLTSSARRSRCCELRRTSRSARPISTRSRSASDRWPGRASGSRGSRTSC